MPFLRVFLSTGGLIALAIILGLAVVFVFVWVFGHWKGRALTSVLPAKSIIPEEPQKVEGKQLPSLFGQGKFTCYVIGRDNTFKASTIKEPIGAIIIADPSVSSIGTTGPVSLLVETEQGDYIAYDPRSGEKYDAKLSPQWAYFTTHWEIVKEIFRVIRPWWQSASLWFTVAAFALVFFVILIVIG